MGNCSVNSDFPSKHVYSTFPDLQKWKNQFESLGMLEVDIGRLYKIFLKVDTDRGGKINLLELLMFLDIERTSFNKRVFSIFDSDGSGSIDFCEFVLSLWNYCTLDSSTLVIFAFDIYDRDSSGDIGPGEVKNMLKELYGSRYKKNPHTTAVLNQLDKLELTSINIDNFRLLAEKANIHDIIYYYCPDINMIIIIQVCLFHSFFDVFLHAASSVIIPSV